MSTEKPYDLNDYGNNPHILRHLTSNEDVKWYTYGDHIEPFVDPIPPPTGIRPLAQWIPKSPSEWEHGWMETKDGELSRLFQN